MLKSRQFRKTCQNVCYIYIYIYVYICVYMYITLYIYIYINTYQPCVSVSQLPAALRRPQSPYLSFLSPCFRYPSIRTFEVGIHSDPFGSISHTRYSLSIKIVTKEYAVSVIIYLWFLDVFVFLSVWVHAWYAVAPIDIHSSLGLAWSRCCESVQLQ